MNLIDLNNVNFTNEFKKYFRMKCWKNVDKKLNKIKILQSGFRDFFLLIANGINFLIIT